MTHSDNIVFRGVSMTPDWPSRIRQAQLITKCIKNGIEYGRIKYGDEEDDWGANNNPCRDCAAIKDEYHVPACDIERCPSCGGQTISCDCDYDESA